MRCISHPDFGGRRLGVLRLFSSASRRALPPAANYLGNREDCSHAPYDENHAQYAPVPVEKQVAIIYLGTQGLLRNVPVRRIKEFEEHFLLEMENKLPDVMAEFKKGNLPEDGMKKMVELVNGLIPQYKS